MPRKSPALRLAPPTSAPSTLATAISSAAFPRLDRAAIKKTHRLPFRTETAGEILAQGRVNLSHVVRGRRQAGPDRPDRLIGDDRVRGRGSVGHRAGELPGDDIEGRSGLALALALAEADDGDEPGPPRGFPPSRAHPRRSRRGPRGVRNGRRSRRVAPASRSISAEMSPVCAPDALTWQSCAPMASGVPTEATAAV